MSLTQALQHLLKSELITLKDPPKNPSTSARSYNPNARCAYYSINPGHGVKDGRPLKRAIKDLIMTLKSEKTTTMKSRQLSHDNKVTTTESRQLSHDNGITTAESR